MPAGRNNLCLWQYLLSLPLNYSKPLHWEKAKAKKGKNNLRNRAT